VFRYGKAGLPLAFFGMLGFIFFSIDQIVLKYFWGYDIVGHYALAARIISGLALLAGIVGTVVFPHLARSRGNRVHSRVQIRFYVALLGGCGTLAGTAGAATAPFLVPWIFGSAYAPSVFVFQILCVLLPFLFMTHVLDFMLIAYHKQSQDLLLTLFAAVCNVILAFVLIPKFGPAGAAWATVVSQVLNFLLTALYTKRLLWSDPGPASEPTGAMIY
jgi:O-antigen/teichoic acid export membrane protein